MSNPYASTSVPFTDVASDFQKLATIPDNLKDTYIDFGATDFATIREGLIKYIKAVYPTDYNNFVESDLGMMLIELVSYMGAVMSLKSDMLANENFIATAKDINSIRKLFNLVGIHMKGPISSQASVKVTVEGQSELTDHLTLSPPQRVFTVVSPEDGEPLNFTLYRIEDGVVDSPNDAGSVTFTSSLDSSSTGIYSEGVLLEGAFAIQSGTFSNINALRSIKLEESPVIQNSTQVYITSPSLPLAEGAYRQVDNLFQASSTSDKLFEVTYNNDYEGTVVFGDGNNGVNPPALADYYITYRVGGGTRGNIPNSYVNAVGTGLYGGISQNIRIVQDRIATGGADAETKEHAKKYGPLVFKTQDRLVSLEDYIAFANNYKTPLGATGKATASTRQAYSSANIIDLYLLEKASSTQFQKASLAFKADMLEAISSKKMITDEVVLGDGLIRTLDLVVTISIDKSFEGIESTISNRVANRIQEYFLVDNWTFGDSLGLGNLNKYIFETEDVIFSSIDNLKEDINVEFNEVIQLNNVKVNISLV